MTHTTSRYAAPSDLVINDRLGLQPKPKEVCCQGFRMGDQPMYKPIAMAHARARTQPHRCNGCKSFELCKPPIQ